MRYLGRHNIQNVNLFINDIPVKIIDSVNKPDKHDFNHVINAHTEPITIAKLLHRVWVKHAKTEDIDSILDLLDTTRPAGLISLTLTVDDYEGIRRFLKEKFKIIKAAGGLVRKGDKILMIYRLKKVIIFLLAGGWGIAFLKYIGNQKYYITNIKLAI